MNEFARNTVQQVPYRFSALDEAPQESRKKRLLALLNKGLPTLPQYLLDLNALLGSPTVELKSVGKVIRTDPSLSAQVLRLCNSALSDCDGALSVSTRPRYFSEQNGCALWC